MSAWWPDRSSQVLLVGATGRSSTVEVAASPPAVRLGRKQAFQLHQAPDPDAVGAEVGLDIRGHLADGVSPPNQVIERMFENESSRLLPAKELGCGSGVTCWRRLRDWQDAGLWEALHHRLLDWLSDDGPG
jgi:hypothetical protein